MSSIQTSQAGHVLTVTIHNPERRNSVSADMLGALRDIFQSIDTTAVRCVVLRGEGDRAFCSGYDLGALPKDQQGGANFEGPQRLTDACNAIAACPVPTIAALHGACFGAGGELAVSCDIRVSSDQVKFGMPPAKLGIVYQQAGLARFVRLIGQARSKYIFFTAATLLAEDLQRLGLVEQVMPSDTFWQSLTTLATTIAGNAPRAVQGSKQIIDAVQPFCFTENENKRFDLLRLAAFQSADYREGLAAMAEKRSPEFTGE